MIAEPVWFRYIVWDMSDPSFPVAKGLAEDTPKEIVEQYERDRKAYREARDADPDSLII